MNELLSELLWLLARLVLLLLAAAFGLLAFVATFGTHFDTALKWYCLGVVAVLADMLAEHARESW